MIDYEDDEECKDCGCWPCQCDELDDRDDWWEDAIANCSMGRDGLCGKAGSEECDFECPFSH